jgi:GT2 family glycosyltransferase
MVLNFNGWDHLRPCFESLAHLDVFVPNAPGQPRDPSRRDDVWLVDNASTDGSADLVRSRFPWVHVVQSEQNLGFSAAYNRAAALADSECLVFLNNDTRVDPAFLSALHQQYDLHPGAFAVAGRMMSWDGRRIDFTQADTFFTGHAWQRGLGQAAEHSAFTSSQALFGCAGALLVERKTFLEIGGFDPDYFSFFEDVDLGWRATLLGHDTWFAPDALVFHAQHGTWGRQPSARTTYLTERNALFTVFKNYHEERMGVMLLLAAALTFLRGWHSSHRIRMQRQPFLSSAGMIHWLALADLTAYLPNLRQRRAQVQAARRRSDQEILPLFGAFASPPDALGDGYRTVLRCLTRVAGVSDESVGGPFSPETNATAEEAALLLAELCRDAVAVQYPAAPFVTQAWDPLWEHEVSPDNAGILQNATLALEQFAAAGSDPGSFATLVAALRSARSHPSGTHSRTASTSRMGTAVSINAAATTPTVSTIVRTKDRPQLLHRALASLAAQSLKPDEVVVINDNGTDPAPVLHQFEDALTLVVVTPAHSLGRTRAAQLGLETASGRYVNFLDDDDELLPDHLRNLMDAVVRTGTRVAYADVECVVDSADGSAIVREVLGSTFDPSRLLFENTIPIMAVLAERELLFEVGGFDPDIQYFEDWDLWIRMARRTHFEHCPLVTARYHLGSTGQSGGLAGNHRWPPLAKLFDKHRASISGQDWARFYQQHVEATRERLREIEDEWSRATQVVEELQARLHTIESSLGWRFYQRLRRLLGRR